MDCIDENDELQPIQRISSFPSSYKSRAKISRNKTFIQTVLPETATTINTHRGLIIDNRVGVAFAVQFQPVINNKQEEYANLFSAPSKLVFQFSFFIYIYIYIAIITIDTGKTFTRRTNDLFGIRSTILESAP